MLRGIAIAFGSNLGDRRSAILSAAESVSRLVSDFHLSSLIETVPADTARAYDPRYLNAAGIGLSNLPARALLAELLGIEQRFGRTRPYPGAPRIIDLDLILVGDEVIDEPGLHVPHPRFRERRFVLEPLAEIAPDLRDPLTRMTIGELLDRLAVRQEHNQKPKH
jgi:2-amino-4-hydroxy-6-hydroxymethyldihydropteridine diphosphokinase